MPKFPASNCILPCLVRNYKVDVLIYKIDALNYKVGYLSKCSTKFYIA